MVWTCPGEGTVNIMGQGDAEVESGKQEAWRKGTEDIFGCSERTMNVAVVREEDAKD